MFLRGGVRFLFVLIIVVNIFVVVFYIFTASEENYRLKVKTKPIGTFSKSFLNII